MGASCTTGAAASSVLQQGACERQDILLQVAGSMQEILEGDNRRAMISLVHRRVTEEATTSPELARSTYGDAYIAYRERVLLGIQSENAHTATGASLDWDDIVEEGRDLADEWRCEIDSSRGPGEIRPR